MQPQMAIIMENTLSAMALRSLLSDMVPEIDVMAYSSMDEYLAAAPKIVAHHFISASVAFHNSAFFQPLMRRTIVVTDGSASPFVQTGYRTIDATASEQSIVRTILEIHHSGHPGGHAVCGSHHGHPVSPEATHERAQLLSSREKDVLALVVKGYINKEIAEQLNISLATVVYHRNNISEKLKTRSIGRLTIYAVLNNIVMLSEI